MIFALSNAATALTAVLSVASVQDSELDRRLDELVVRLDERREAHHIPGLAIAVVRDDEVVLARGLGLADIENQRPVTEETLFAIGSTSKAFTSALIAMLVDEGQMGWDEPITEYLPYFELQVDRGKRRKDVEISVRDLLCHRTGFTRMGILWAGGDVSRETVLRTATQAKPLESYRAKFLYNNVMFLAAGEASAQVAGTDWDTLVAERLFEPLGMSSSTTRVAEAQTDERLALGYEWREERGEWEHQPMRVLDTIAPAGAINSNVIDMAQWLRLQLGRGEIDGQRLISEEALTETWRPRMAIGGNTRYALGWFTDQWEGHRVVQHGGNIDGFGAMVGMLPDDGIGFVLLTNVTASPLQAESREIVWSAMLGELEESVDEADEEAIAKLSSSALDGVAGEYRANFAAFDDETFTVTQDEDGLRVDIPSQRVYELEAADADGRHATLGFEFSFSFARDESGQVVALLLHEGGFEFEAPKIGVEREIEIPLAELERYLGRYEATLFPEPVEVCIQNDHLAVDVPGQMIYELHPPDDEARWVFRLTDEIAVVFDETDEGGIRGLTMHQSGMEFAMPRIDEKPAADLPTLEEFHAQRDTAGRAERLRALSPFRVETAVQLVHAGVKGTSTWTVDGPRNRNELDFGPFGYQRSATDGVRAFSDSSFDAFQELEGKYRDQALVSDPSLFLGDWRPLFDSEKLTRADELDGRAVWVIELEKSEIPRVRLSVDAETGDVLRVDSAQLMMGLGETLPQTVDLAAVREVEGVRFPHRYTTSNVASGDIVVEVQSIATGIEVADETFVLESDDEE